MRIFLTPETNSSNGRFFVEVDDGAYWIGRLDGRDGFVDRQRIGADLFKAFVVEASKNTAEFHNKNPET